MKPYCSPMHVLGLSLGLNIGLTTASWGTDSGEEKSATPVTFNSIVADVDGRASIIEISLAQAPQWSKVIPLQEHGSFLQLILPGTFVPEPGKFYDIGGAAITKAAVFQLTPSDAGVRLFVNRPAAQVKRAAIVTLDGNRVVVTIDHQKVNAEAIASMGPPAPTEEEVSSTSVASADADAIIAATTVDRTIPEPATLLAAANPAPSQPAAEGPITTAKLRQVAIFCGIMLIVGAIAWLVKPLLRRRRQKTSSDGEPPVTMQTLATLPLAPRQKIALIQVGTERFLIAVTPDQVTFLKALKDAAGTIQPLLAPAAGVHDGHFANVLERERTVEVMRTPTLKNLPGNDARSLAAQPENPKLRQPSSQPTPRSKPQVKDSLVERAPKTSMKSKPAEARPSDPKSGAVSGRRVNVQVSDDGIKDLTGPLSQPDQQRAADDVTRLIREKLKTLRTLT